MKSPVAEIWDPLQKQLESENERLLGVWKQTWEQVLALLEQQKSAWEELQSWTRQTAPLASLEDLFDARARELAVEAFHRLLRGRVIERALQALEDHGAAREILIRQLPAMVSISGRELAKELPRVGRNTLRRPWMRWQRRQRLLPLRALVEDELRRQTLTQAELVGSFFLALARLCADLVTPWQVLRRVALRDLLGQTGNPGAAHASWDRWVQRSERNVQLGRRALERLQARIQAGPSDLAAHLPRRWRPVAEKRRAVEADRLKACYSFWTRQHRAIAALLELEITLAETAKCAIREAQQRVAGLESEHAGFLAELDAVIAWLESWERGEAAGVFPTPRVHLLAAQERVSDWFRALASLARSRVPETVETVHPRRALPGRRPPWRQLTPQRKLLEALESPIAREPLLEGLKEAETVHRAIVSAIERARQVVEFGFEAAREQEETGVELAREAVANAKSLLVHERESALPVRQPAEQGFALSLAAAFQQCFIALEQGRLGLWTHLAQEGGRYALRLAARLVLEAAREFVRVAGTRARELGHRFLVWIGWSRPPVPRLEHVIRRTYVGENLGVDFRVRDLPAIYRRLFRPDPLDDPRFLIGREEEMAALSELRHLWKSGRSAAGIVVGERGSGKTSLLNCAQAQLFAGDDLVRGQFCHRIRSSDDMRRFLSDLLGFSAAEDPAAALQASRRVVILEELERSFLRQVNGYQGLRDLLSLIASTSHTVLWILVINQTAFEFLNAAVRLGDFFSHRINTMSVDPEALKSAILVRHNLSGLRLQYAPPPVDRRADTLRRRILGLEPDPEQLFFDALYRESEGVFRSAFELWQSYIERVEGGVLRMRFPMPPDYTPLFSGLSEDDLFTLQALLQHGGLTLEEHTAIFQCPEKESLARIEMLEDREIIQPEPDRPGFRVRPEAARLVRDALHRRNLL